MTQRLCPCEPNAPPAARSAGLSLTRPAALTSPWGLSRRTCGLSCASARHLGFPEGGPSCLSLLPSPLGLTAGVPPSPVGPPRAQLPAAALPSPGSPSSACALSPQAGRGGGCEGSVSTGLWEEAPKPHPEPPAGAPAPPVNSLQHLCVLASAPVGSRARPSAQVRAPLLTSGRPPSLSAALPSLSRCLLPIFLPPVAAERVSYHLR